MYAKSLKVRIFYYAAPLLLFLVFISDLRAEPPVRILSIDSSAYPHIALTLSARQPHLEFVQKEPKTVFAVSEIYRNLERRIEEFNVQTLKKEAQNVNIVWIVDASLSLQPQSFQKATAFSQKFIAAFQNGERMAIYSAKAKPELLLDFSSEKEKLAKTLRYIRHDGKITRLYDALYSGIYTAQSAWQSKGEEPNESRTVVVLLTDGKEESSYFNDNDCYELSSIGKRLNIPVYVLLWNGAGKKKTKNETEHYRLLKRLTLKTKGDLLSKPREKEAPALLQKLYQLSQPIYRIDYLSQKKQHDLLGSSVIVRVALKEGGYSAISSFRVPWFAAFLGNVNPFVWLACALALLLSTIIILLFAVPYRRYKMRKREAIPNEMGGYTLFEEQLEKEKLAPRNKERKPSASAASPKQEHEARENTQDIQDIQELQNTQDALPPLEVPRDSKHVLIENERSLYLREHSYRVLQLALRDALAYKRAALRTVIPSEPPQKRVYDLFLDSTLLGSGRWAHIPVRDPLASPIHARIKKVNQRFIIYDMLSGSGLYVNSRKLLRPKGLKHGDEIRIGRMSYTFLGK